MTQSLCVSSSASYASGAESHGEPRTKINIKMFNIKKDQLTPLSFSEVTSEALDAGVLREQKFGLQVGPGEWLAGNQCCTPKLQNEKTMVAMADKNQDGGKFKSAKLIEQHKP